MNRIACLCLVAAASVATGLVDITGTVTDQRASPVEGATVELVGEGLSTITDASGNYHLVNEATTVPRADPLRSGALTLRDGRIVFSLAWPTMVTVSVFDTRGAVITKPMDAVMGTGSHAVPIFSARTAHQVLIIRAQAGNRTAVFRHVFVAQACRADAGAAAGSSSLAKSAAAVDTIRASKAGYVTKSVPVESLVDTVDIVLDDESTAGEYITTPEKHGWSDSKTVAQNTAAFNAAIQDASDNAGSSSTGRGVVELVAKKVYVVAASGPGTRDNQKPALLLGASQSNVEIRTKGKPVVGSGNQAIIRFESWASKTNVCREELVLFQGTDNCRLGWVALDGNKISVGATFSERTNWLTSKLIYSQGGNGGIYNLRFDGSSRCAVYEVESANSLTDGIVLGKKQASQEVHGLTVTNCDFHHNRRQGMTVASAGDISKTWDQVVFKGCTFRNTGDEAGIYGQQPGAGVDIEPDQSTQDVTGLTFDDCDFTGNAGSVFNSGKIGSSSRGSGLEEYQSSVNKYFKMINCRVQNNRWSLVFIFKPNTDPTWSHWELSNLVINGNAQNNYIYLTASGTPSPGLGRLTNAKLVNNNVALIEFENDIAPTGQGIEVWKGDYNPTITTNGRQTVTVKEGFPQ